MKDVLQQIEDNQAERAGAAEAAALDQEMADSRRLLSSIAALPHDPHAGREAEQGGPEAGE